MITNILGIDVQTFEKMIIDMNVSLENNHHFKFRTISQLNINQYKIIINMLSNIKSKYGLNNISSLKILSTIETYNTGISCCVPEENGTTRYTKYVNTPYDINGVLKYIVEPEVMQEWMEYYDNYQKEPSKYKLCLLEKKYNVKRDVIYKWITTYKTGNYVNVYRKFQNGGGLIRIQKKYPMSAEEYCAHKEHQLSELNNTLKGLREAAEDWSARNDVKATVTWSKVEPLPNDKSLKDKIVRFFKRLFK